MTRKSPSVPELSHVSVLLATYNGEPWIEAQLESLRKQLNVRLSVIASDDGSSDQTVNVLRQCQDSISLQILPTCERMGNANKNFLRLICEAPIGNADFVAFADQDDVWFEEKLHRAVHEIVDRKLHAYSSDVVAMWPDGKLKQLKKGSPMREFDYLFEAAGPGCTYVLRRSAFDALRLFARVQRGALSKLKVHDWWIYAFGRVNGWTWFIDPQASMMYRQHGGNEVGANVGWSAGRRRLKNALDGRFRRDAIAVANVVGDKSVVMRSLLRHEGWDRLKLALMAPRCRRRLRDAAVLALIHLLARRVDTE